MSELSIFVDESGDQSGSKFYLITLVFHDQSDGFYQFETPYTQSLIDRNLPDIPFHMGPLMNGHEDYQTLPLRDRKRLLAAFSIFTQHFPFRYKTLSYIKAEAPSMDALLLHMKRDLILFLFDNLSYLQTFEKIKIYYDNGQVIVTEALHAAIEYALSKDAIIYKDAKPQAYRLFQLADYICTLELIALKYQLHDDRPTDRLFFGNWGSFKKNSLKKIRKYQL